MKTINKNSYTKIYWKIFKGNNKVSEDFHSLNTELKVFVVGTGNKYYIATIINRVLEPGYDVIEVDIPSGMLEEGAYDLRAIWWKNKGRDLLVSNRCGIFGITDSIEEAPIEDLAEIRIASYTENFGRDGMSAYETAVMYDLHLGITSEKEWVMQETIRIQNENARKAAEEERKSNEASRVSEETKRVTAETARKYAEDARVSQEATRKTFEEARNNAENARKASETTRAEQEYARINSENYRAESENTRVSNENNRVEAEKKRVANETSREAAEDNREARFTQSEQNRSNRFNTAEIARNANETSRVAAEGKRVVAESNRASSEATRVSNENQRIANENARKAAEDERQATYQSKLGKGDIVQTTGSSTDKVMSQKAVTDAIKKAGGSSSSSVTIVNNLTEGGADKALSAEMGKTLSERIEEVSEQGGGMTEIPDGGVTTAKIANGAVTNAKVAPGAIKLNNLADEVMDIITVGGGAGEDKDITITDITKQTGYYYSLNSRALKANSNYFTITIDILNNATAFTAVFVQSTTGGIGVEFQDDNGEVTGKFSNMTEPLGTKIRVDIPVGTTKMIYSYLTDTGASYEKVSLFDGITFHISYASAISTIKHDLGLLKASVFGGTEDLAVEVPNHIRTNGYYYNLATRTLTADEDYFTAVIKVPKGATSMRMRINSFDSNIDTGVEFRDILRRPLSTYRNTSSDVVQGDVEEITIPKGASSFIFSYKVDDKAIDKDENPKVFSPILFFDSSNEGLHYKVEELSSGDASILGSMYISGDTDNILEDGLTLEELYQGYDELCVRFPEYIKRLGNIGTDAAGNEIRQYRIGYNNQYYNESGESAYPEKGGTNMWTDDIAPNKILVNTGTHGDEKAPCYSVMLAITDLLESKESWAMQIKSTATIYLCPTLNPYGFQNRTLANYNGVNINRDITNQTQPESQAWKSWIDANLDAIIYIDVHGCDYYTPYLQYAKIDTTEENIKLYSRLTFGMSSIFKENWDKVFAIKGWSRPYMLRSSYEGTTTSYTTSKSLKGFVLETPCDVVSNQYNPAPNYVKNYSKSNKMTKDMLIYLLGYFSK